ncbi:MAG: DnaA regulatory inactivator Hda [Steroidobacter sp.]
MRQLPLLVRLRTLSVFSSFYAGSNVDVVQCLQQQQFGSSPVVFLYGVHGTGKTHLLQALCVQASMRGQQAVYTTLSDLQEYGAGLLTGSSQESMLCIDDVDTLLIDAEWNHALFNVYREMEEQQGKLIMAASGPPASYQFPLADLASRVMAGTVLRLQPLNEDEQLQALQLHAVQRGLELPEETAQYLLRRLPRDMSTLCDFLDELDIASLAEQRKLTVPFVKKVLDEI